MTERLVLFVVIVAAGAPALLLPRRALFLLDEAISGRAWALAIAGGLAGGVALHFALRRTSRYRFLEVWLHEHAHLLAIVILGGAPKTLNSDRRGTGHVEYEIAGPLLTLRRTLIDLVPYWFSPLLIPPLVACLLRYPSSLASRFSLALVAGLGMVISISQLSLGQPDLHRLGRYRAAHSVKFRASNLVQKIAVLRQNPAAAASFAASVWLWASTFVLMVACLRSGTLAAVPQAYRAAWRSLTT